MDELIFIDLAATEENRKPDFDIIKDVMQECFMPVTIGGGIHSIGDISALLKIGADKVSINSEASKHHGFITEAAKKFGSQCIVVSIDSKRHANDHYVFTKRGAANAKLKTADWARQAQELGAGEILLTSVDRDGTMEGMDIELIKEVASSVSIPVIACGGGGKVQDIIDAVNIGKADAVSIASMFHYSGHTADSIKERMARAGISVRLL